MKKSILIFLAFILTACSTTPSQVTVTPEATVTLTPLPTLTPTPVAVDGVAEIDGAFYIFDQTAQAWTALPEIDRDFDRIMVKEDGSVVAVDENGVEIFALNVDTNEWGAVEKVYTSCVDPELQAEVDAEFLEKTGETVQEMIQRLLDTGLDTIYRSIREWGLEGSDMIFVGVKEASISHITGNEGDTAICLMSAELDQPEQRVPNIIALTINGEYKTMAVFGATNRGDQESTPFSFDSKEELLAYIRDSLPLGSHIHVNIQTFANAKDADWKNFDQVTVYSAPAVKLFVDDEFLGRMRGKQTWEAVQALDPKKDVGLFPWKIGIEDVEWMNK